MKLEFLIGIVWTIGVLLTGKLNNIITGGRYASGIAILLMMFFLMIAFGILFGKCNDVQTRKAE